MYGNKLAAAIKVNGKVLREFKDTIYIPFGAEYAITLKNLHTTRAVINVYIDGDNVVPGGLVLNAGQSIDLERSIRNNNLTEGNRFKFIERTGKIEDHRGIGVEDGLVRIEYQFERVQPAQIWNSQPIYKVQDVFGSSGMWNSGGSNFNSFNVGGQMRGADFSAGEKTKAVASAAINSTLRSMNITASSAEVHDGSATMDCNDTGITVPGSKSTQKFTETTMGIMETEKYSLVFKLVGDLGDNKPVEKAVTVKAKPKCVTCGKQNKAHAKFCSECGTALEIFA